MTWTDAFADRKWTRHFGPIPTGCTTSTSIRETSNRAASARHLAAAALLFVLAVPSAGFALPFGNLIVFGDSLVDQGNTQTFATIAGVPDPTPAASGYFGGRFTNGLNIADVVNQGIEGTNAVGTIFGGDDYAWGGARARSNGDFLPDLAAQVADYLGRPPGPPTVPADTLILINAGGNDARDIVLGNLSGAARQAVIDGAVAAVKSSILSLQAAGAQSIFFVGIGNVGGIPEIGALGAAAAAAGRQASIDLNTAIRAVLPANAYYFDTIAFSDQLLANPGLFGLPPGINTTTSCLAGGGASPAGPPTCAGYAFFDNVHPTTQVQQLIGAQILTMIPEPGTAVLLMSGLVVLAAKRRSAGA